ncbi:LEM domain-containing protein 2-like [Oscarella lobularis]|uniref:LEM domain-containing protein 2-like n=1 Tax=Oscarella lobularis TaxID=121494 RepID=UPI00331408B3
MALEKIRRLVFIVISVPLTCLLLIRLAYWYKKRKEKDEKLMFALVNGIIEAVEEQSKRHARKPYIAQKVLRDKLISPRDRKSMARYWTMAIDWLAENESRLRLGTVRVAGEDVSAWMWIGATAVSQELSDNDEN